MSNNKKEVKLLTKDILIQLEIEINIIVNEFNFDTCYGSLNKLNKIKAITKRVEISLGKLAKFN